MTDPLISLGGFLDRLALSAVRLQGWKSRFVDTPDGHVHLFDIRGRGPLPPILLLHGLGSRSADYALLIRRLKRLTRRLIVPDVPGHGLSRVPEGGLQPEMMESSLLSAVDEVLDEEAVDALQPELPLQAARMQRRPQPRLQLRRQRLREWRRLWLRRRPAGPGDPRLRGSPGTASRSG